MGVLKRVSAKMGESSYLVQDVLKRVGAIDREADKNEIGFRVRKRPQAVVLLLTGCVPQCKLDSLAAGHVGGICDVVLKDCWDVFLFGRSLVGCLLQSRKHLGAYLWEVALAVADEQTCLSAAAISDDDNLL